VSVEYPAGHFPWAPDNSRLVRAYTNVDEEERRGVELSARYKFNEKINAFANYTWQKSKVNFSGGTSTRTWIAGIPEHLVKLGVNYNYKNWDVTLDGTYASHRNGDNSIPTGIYYASYDPYFIANLRLGYKLNDNVQMAVYVNNLFDREYYEDYIAPGRTFMLETRLSF
jgi:outer membrane receptor protein involved in Fe transport